MTLKSRYGSFLLAVLSGLAGLAGRPALAANWALQNYGDFTKSEALHAQVYLKAAMSESMTQAARGASEIRAAEMLDYGLGLALGREPATEALDPPAKARVHSLFQTAIALYQADLGDSTKIGDDAAAINQADFWIWMSRMLSMSARTSLEVASIATSTGSPNSPSPVAPGADLVTGTLSSNTGDFLGPDGRSYDLKGDLPVLAPRVVSAAHACADYAYTAARMKRVTALDPNGNSKVSPAKMRELQQQASSLIQAAEGRGPGACGGQDFFAKVEAYAAGNLGHVGQLKLGGQTASDGGDSPKDATTR
jgi:hypothetical protein